MTKLEDITNDKCPTAQTRQDMKIKLQRPVKHGQLVELKVNVAKTKFTKLNVNTVYSQDYFPSMERESF